MEYVVTVLIFVVIGFLSFMLGVGKLFVKFIFWNIIHTLTSFCEDLIDLIECVPAIHSYYKGYVYAIKLISIRLGLKFSEEKEEKQ